MAASKNDEQDSTQKKHHYGKRIQESNDNLANLKASVEKDEARIKQLEDNLRATDAAQLKEMRERVSKHDIYFGILTAVTTIVVIAIAGELIKRWMAARS